MLILVYQWRPDNIFSNVTMFSMYFLHYFFYINTFLINTFLCRIKKSHKVYKRYINLLTVWITFGSLKRAKFLNKHVSHTIYVIWNRFIVSNKIFHPICHHFKSMTCPIYVKHSIYYQNPLYFHRFDSTSFG